MPWLRRCLLANLSGYEPRQSDVGWRQWRRPPEPDRVGEELSGARSDVDLVPVKGKDRLEAIDRLIDVDPLRTAPTTRFGAIGYLFEEAQRHLDDRHNATVWIVVQPNADTDHRRSRPTTWKPT